MSLSERIYAQAELLARKAARMNIPIQLISGGKMPTKAYATDAGWDCYPRQGDKTWAISANHVAPVPLGFKTAIPDGWFARILCKSRYAELGLHILGGVIDSGYRGEWIALLYWPSESKYDIWKFDPHMSICQFTIHCVPNVTFEQVSELPPSDRGEGGFGSTSHGQG